MSDVLAALDRQAARQPAAMAFTDDAGCIDYRMLARRVAGFAAHAKNLPPTIGLLAPSSIEWAVIDLALWQSGHTVVPLPHFFADAQLRHIVDDAGLGAILASDDQLARAQGFGVPVQPLTAPEAEPAPAAMAGRRIVYTSGSTGRPKGVVLGAGEIAHTCSALMQAVGAGPDDRHLSVLPFSLLLEAICGVYLPVLAGGTCSIAADVVAAKGPEIATRLGEAAQRVAPTTSVLVPQLLQAWVMAATVGRVEIPDSLRFVAVGGAAVPMPLAERAWQLGIPVHEGYGLTECGSVVAVNTPGQRRTGTVGRPLAGYDVELAADGEIIVTSASVTPGYLNGKLTDGDNLRRWPTGDLGAFDADGYLQVLGRKDSLIVTANGRNLSPEWIETMVLADPRIAQCIVLGTPEGELAVALEPSMLGAAWFEKADPEKVAALLTGLCTQAPDYAQPRQSLVLAPGELAAAGLLTPNGRPRRREIGRHVAPQLSASEPSRKADHAVF
jgi:long-subunit acyl-CoA synthetase (AMP-forming)